MSDDKVVLSGIISFPHLFQPKVWPDGKTEYSCNIILLPGFFETPAYQLLEQRINEAAAGKWGTNVPADFQRPYKPVKEEGPYHGQWQVTAKRKIDFGKPDVRDQNVQPLLLPELIPAGSKVNVVVSVFPYSTSGNNGAGLGLELVQLVETAGTESLPSLATGIKAENYFQPIAGAPAATAAPPIPQAAPAPGVAPSPAPAPAPTAAPAPAPAPAVGPVPGGVDPAAPPAFDPNNPVG